MGALSHACGLGPSDWGPYLLGRLAPEDERRVASAVALCPACAHELPPLQRVAAALPRTARPEPLPPPETLLDDVLSRVGDSRRRARRARLATAAAAVVLAAVVAGVAALSLRTLVVDDGRSLTLSGGGGVEGTAVLVTEPAGTSVSLRMTGLEPGIAYGAWLARPDGSRLPAGSFRTGSDGSAAVELSAALPLDDTATIGLTELGGDDVLEVALD